MKRRNLIILFGLTFAAIVGTFVPEEMRDWLWTIMPVVLVIAVYLDLSTKIENLSMDLACAEDKIAELDPDWNASDTFRDRY